MSKSVGTPDNRRPLKDLKGVKDQAERQIDEDVAQRSTIKQLHLLN